MIVFLILIGWFLFVIFCGVGIVALPLDLILGYFYRPQVRTATEIAERKVGLRRRAEELTLFAEKLKSEIEDSNFETGGFFDKLKSKS